jgi:hypothetical protein
MVLCSEFSGEQPPFKELQSRQARQRLPGGIHLEPRDLTCDSMRVAELRECLVRELSRCAVICAQAQQAFLDGSDEFGLSLLRAHWRVVRAGLGPMASELGRLSENSEAAL